MVALGYLLAGWGMNPVSSILPTITQGLNIDVQRAGWLMNAFFAVLVSSVLTAGKLGDASGNKMAGLVTGDVADADHLAHAGVEGDGVHVSDADRPCSEVRASLLLDLAERAGDDTLTRLQGAAGNAPALLPLLAEEEHAVAGVDYEGEDGNREDGEVPSPVGAGDGECCGLGHAAGANGTPLSAR